MKNLYTGPYGCCYQVKPHQMLGDAGMVGDVNLYLNDADDLKTGEIEVIPSQPLVTVP